MNLLCRFSEDNKSHQDTTTITFQMVFDGDLPWYKVKKTPETNPRTVKFATIWWSSLFHGKPLRFLWWIKMWRNPYNKQTPTIAQTRKQNMSYSTIKKKHYTTCVYFQNINHLSSAPFADHRYCKGHCHTGPNNYYNPGNLRYPPPQSYPPKK